jgi:hypothetical protein
LLDLVRLGAARGWAGAGAAFYAKHRTVSGNALQARKHVEERPHVGRFLLYPNDVGILAVAVEFGDDFFFGKRIKLLQENDRR